MVLRGAMRIQNFRHSSNPSFSAKKKPVTVMVTGFFVFFSLFVFPYRDHRFVTELICFAHKR